MNLFDLKPRPSEGTECCCFQFRNMLEWGGSRGLSIIVTDGSVESKKYLFYIQMRATNADEQNTVPTNVPVALHMNLSIDFCPWCGKNLQQFYSQASLPVHPELVEY